MENVIFILLYLDQSTHDEWVTQNHEKNENRSLDGLLVVLGANLHPVCSPNLERIVKCLLRKL